MHISNNATSRCQCAPTRQEEEAPCEGAGLMDDPGRADTIGSSLDHLIGIWTAGEADEMDSALEEFETMDEAIWE